MSECTELSDRMPLVALGKAGWTAEEARHLSGCRSCQAEWDLLGLAIRLGETGPELQRSQVAEAVLRRLDRERVVRLRKKTWGFAGLAAAAALAALVWSGQPATRPVFLPSGPSVARLQIPLPELDSLPSAELDSVLKTMDEPVGNGSAGESGLGDLDSTELQNVLDYWEG
jgi:hypothetical protein